MEAYAKVYEDLDLSRPLIDCALGRVDSPVMGLESPAGWYAFPPALIPLWSDGSRPTYIGAWKHWFIDQARTFVKMYVASERLTVEIARTPEQILSVVAMMAISVDDGIEPTLEKFAKEVGLKNLAEIDEVSLNSGDDPKGFTNIGCFATKTPLESVSDKQNYDGDFAISDLSEGTDWMNQACWFELSESFREVIHEIKDKPVWLEDRSNWPQVFSGFLEAGELGNAWMTLNSPGWKISDAREAIKALESTASNEKFSRLTEAWLEVADPGSGSY